MIWFLIFGLSFWMAWRARQGEALLIQQPDHPNAQKILGAIGISWMQAIILMAMFPITVKGFTDNIIPVLVLVVAGGLVAIAVYYEWYQQITVANAWMKRAFFALAAGIVIMSFTVPAEDYNIPEQAAEQEMQYDGKDAQPLPNSYVSPAQ